MGEIYEIDELIQILENIKKIGHGEYSSPKAHYCLAQAIKCLEKAIKYLDKEIIMIDERLQAHLNEED